MSNSFGEKIKATVFGQSHSEIIGVVVDGLPAGFQPDIVKLNAFMARRSSVNKEYSTKRKESDSVEFVSGIVNGRTCGAPVCMITRNTDIRSSDYAQFSDIPRPSHSDYAAYMKFSGFNDIRGGGQFSGRMTAPLCMAGGLALQILEANNVFIGAHISEIAGISDDSFNPAEISADDFKAIGTFPVLNPKSGALMLSAVEEARSRTDSVGGIVECAVVGVNAGFGEPMFDGVENVIARAVFAVPAVKGIEFGSGFNGSRLYGSENNDPFIMDGEKVKTVTNNSGGILGGITNGMPIIFRAAIKPTPSIGIEQDSVSLSDGKPCKLRINGRHDPCIVPRAVPVIEAVTALAILELIGAN